ncbi:hypothetical protein [Campylobacter curvus]|uniref:hypothetical protein n=1 Tax=Campylobacter curvus TaxID=200 RepID=UPI00147037D9|nr:hypothetical protein [Campylobacter curvus]
MKREFNFFELILSVIATVVLYFAISSFFNVESPSKIDRDFSEGKYDKAIQEDIQRMKEQRVKDGK